MTNHDSTARGGTAIIVISSVLALVLLIGLSIVAWQLGWFVRERNTVRQVQIDNRQLGTQTAWHDEAVNAITDFATVPAANTAARAALRAKACSLIGRLDSPYRSDDLVAFEEGNCP
jgi:hypothetical protein